MSQAVVVSKAQTYLEAHASPQMRAVLPAGMTEAKMVTLAVMAYEKNPDLQKCSLSSLSIALIESAEVGLEPFGVLGEAALVPYGDTVQFQPMYRGLIKLIKEGNPSIHDVHAEIVCTEDTFEFWHSSPEDHFFHQQAIAGRGDPLGAWARVTFKEGPPKILFYDLEKINRIRDMAKAKNGIMWKSHWDEGAKKTVIKAICKTLPQSPKLAKAIHADTLAEGAIDVSLEPSDAMPMPQRKSAPELPPKPETPPTPFDYATLTPPECPEHGPFKLVPAATTGGRGGNGYPAFFSCEGNKSKTVKCKKCKPNYYQAEDWREKQNEAETPVAEPVITPEQIEEGKKLAAEVGMDEEETLKILGFFNFESWESVTANSFDAVMKRFESFRE